jgi:hypothetical protein
LNAAEQALHVYDSYLFILKEKPRVEAFLSESGLKREQFISEIEKFENT